MAGKIKNVGFVSTRLAGTDGVSLETYKWAQVLERNGINCFYFAGELDTPEDASFFEPLAHFAHPEIEAIHRECFGVKIRPRMVSDKFQEIKTKLKNRLYEFCQSFELDMIIPENALAIPMHIPLGMAITEFLAETGMPGIAHHHDFHWERDRFIINAVSDYLQYAFPPALPNIQHVVINSSAGRQLSFRRGISNIVIPNVFDFKNPFEPSLTSVALRTELGFEPGELFILQPTRIVPRKWIERAIEFADLMKNGEPKLVISHAAGDEGNRYVDRIMTYAERMGVKLLLVGDLFDSSHCFNTNDFKQYSIDDVYQACDLVTYPSGYEGFGNAFLEAVYFKKPILVNRYTIFIEDIEPLGFELVSFDTFITSIVAERVADLMAPQNLKKAVEKNYKLASKYYSYEVLEKKLLPLMDIWN